MNDPARDPVTVGAATVYVGSPNVLETLLHEAKVGVDFVGVTDDDTEETVPVPAAFIADTLKV